MLGARGLVPPALGRVQRGVGAARGAAAAAAAAGKADGNGAAGGGKANKGGKGKGGGAKEEGGECYFTGGASARLQGGLGKRQQRRCVSTCGFARSAPLPSFLRDHRAPHLKCPLCPPPYRRHDHQQCRTGPYSATVRTPVTDFSLRANSAAREPEIQGYWEARGVYERLASSNPGVRRSAAAARRSRRRDRRRACCCALRRAARLPTACLSCLLFCLLPPS